MITVCFCFWLFFRFLFRYLNLLRAGNVTAVKEEDFKRKTFLRCSCEQFFFVFTVLFVSSFFFYVVLCHKKKHGMYILNEKEKKERKKEKGKTNVYEQKRTDYAEPLPSWLRLIPRSASARSDWTVRSVVCTSLQTGTDPFLPF